MKKSHSEIATLQSEKIKEPRLPLFGLLENIRSLYNVGSMFRTADGAGLSGLGLVGYTGTPPKKEITKTALGSEIVLPWQTFGTSGEYIRHLKDEGLSNLTTIALEQSSRSIPYTELVLPQGADIILVVGNEVSGIEEETLEVCDIHTEIPMQGMKHSLNVSVAFGILAFHVAMLLKQCRA